MSNFEKRLIAPNKSDIHYYNDNIFYKCGYGMPNCTAYVWGRWYELLGIKPKVYTGNAENWFPKGTSYDGYERGQSPKLGAIACWRKGQAGNDKDGAGHVAIVEEIYADGSILTSNSGYKASLFYTKKIAKGYALSGYAFQGFIYLPIKFDENISESIAQGLIAQVQTYLNQKYNFSLAVDNIFGTKTKTALVKALQIEFNNAYGSKLVADGIFGIKTKNTCQNIRLNANGAIVYLIQAMLICKGYNLVLDGIFGNNTLNAVKDFQSKRKLTVDGIVGKNTFEKMFV